MPREAFGILCTGLMITSLLSFCCSFVIFHYADIFAEVFFKETRCTQLLKILAFTIPFGTIQSCLCGYYFGRHNALVPSAAQLTEQLFRMLSVFLLCKIFFNHKLPLSPVIAVLGLVLGEFCSFLFTITCFSFSHKTFSRQIHRYFFKYIREISALAIPLSGSRICINLLVSLEAALLPNSLKAFGLNDSDALSIYGILTGMALPFILFPNALTSSISLMLLPKVSEFHTERNYKTLSLTLKKIFSFCVGLGCFCWILFLLCGNSLGNLIFSNLLAGKFITTLAWLCPFLYLNTTLSSVLNGLGRTDVTFFTGIGGLFLRVGSIFLTVPKLGIQGYLYGLLTCQLFITVFSCFALRRTLKKL